MSARRDIHLSKTLSWLLRHAGDREGLHISKEGYVNISELLNHKSLKGLYTEDDVKRIVEINDKQRFSLRFNNNKWEICANQGHTLTAITDLSLIPILNSNGIEAIHGTYYKSWPRIQKEGLSRMKRNHIHFAKALPNDKSVVSGARSTAEIFIYINLNFAISDGIKFYKSANDVILSPGDSKGIIETKYFLKVYDVEGKRLL